MRKSTKIIRNILFSLITLIMSAIFLFMLVTVVFNCVYIEAPVIGYSMQPALNADVPSSDIGGDTVYINRYAPIERGDLAVAKVDWWDKDYIVKRVVAVENDTVSIREDENGYGLYINGELLYTRDRTIVSSHGTRGGTVAYYQDYLDFVLNPNNADHLTTIDGEVRIKLLEDEYFLMGDNWEESTDSIKHGAVTSSDLLGNVDIIVRHDESKFWSIVDQVVKMIF